jgi:hypothetical protein
MLWVRSKVYRNRPGYSVYGEGLQIFFDLESQAREFVRRHKEGEDHQNILWDIWKIGR